MGEGQQHHKQKPTTCNCHSRSAGVLRGSSAAPATVEKHLSLINTIFFTCGGKVEKKQRTPPGTGDCFHSLLVRQAIDAQYPSAYRQDCASQDGWTGLFVLFPLLVPCSVWGSLHGPYRSMNFPTRLDLLATATEQPQLVCTPSTGVLCRVRCSCLSFVGWVQRRAMRLGFAYYSEFLHLVAKESDRGAGVVGHSQFELMLPSEPPRELCTLRCSLGSYCRPYALLLAVLPAAARLQGNITIRILLSRDTTGVPYCLNSTGVSFLIFARCSSPSMSILDSHLSSCPQGAVMGKASHPTCST